MLPNFLIIGAMKSGTTTLYELLKGHPEIFMPETKEVGFFVPDGNWGRGIEWYESHFRSAQGAKAIGEASTHYTKHPRYPKAPERIASVLPTARLVYIMRDPVQRTLSHYWHMVRSGGERRGMRAAVRDDSHYVATSRYYYQIQRYLACFKRGQILLLLLEDLEAAPLTVLRAIYEFLGVDPSYIALGAEHPRYVAPDIAGVDGPVLRALRLIPGSGRLGAVLPERFRRFIGYFVKRDVQKPPELPADVANRLRTVFWEDIVKLRELMGRDLTEWKSSHMR